MTGGDATASLLQLVVPVLPVAKEPLGQAVSFSFSKNVSPSEKITKKWAETLLRTGFVHLFCALIITRLCIYVNIAVKLTIIT